MDGSASDSDMVSESPMSSPTPAQNPLDGESAPMKKPECLIHQFKHFRLHVPAFSKALGTAAAYKARHIAPPDCLGMLWGRDRALDGVSDCHRSSERCALGYDRGCESLGRKLDECFVCSEIRYKIRGLDGEPTLTDLREVWYNNLNMMEK